MTDPVTAAVATALATKAIAGLSEAGKSAFDRLARIVRRKLSPEARSSGSLDLAQTYPTSDAHRHALADALSRAMIDDQHFAVQLVNLWRYLQEDREGVSQSSVLNIVSGGVDGKIVQARDIHGQVSFG
jgi:hypothetical protein